MNENTASEINNDTGNIELLQKLKAQAFGGAGDKLALALGRPVEEIEAWLGGAEIDEDAQEKIHALATARLNSGNQAAG